MKGIVILLFTVFAAVVHAQNSMLVEECPKDQETDWTIELLLKHEYCNKFYMCTFGKPVEYVCPADLWFNLETQQCDWRHNVDCTDRYVPDITTTEAITNATDLTTSTEPITTTTELTTSTEQTTIGGTSPDTTTTPEPTTTSTTPEPTTTTTSTPQTSSTTPEPTTTTTSTPQTSSTTPAPTTTTSTTTTTPAPTTTTSTTTTTSAPTTTTSTTTRTTPPPITTKIPQSFLPNGCPTNPQIHWLLPHETDCNAFYYCVWGQLVHRQCPATLHFNRVLQVCDWPWDAECPATLNKHLGSRQQMR